MKTATKTMRQTHLQKLVPPKVTTNLGMA